MIVNRFRVICKSVCVPGYLCLFIRKDSQNFDRASSGLDFNGCKGCNISITSLIQLPFLVGLIVALPGCHPGL